MSEDVERLKSRIAELEAVLDRQWEADMRAIKCWQEKTGKKLEWPERKDLVYWLLEKLKEAEEGTLTQYLQKVREFEEESRKVNIVVGSHEKEIDRLLDEAAKEVNARIEEMDKMRRAPIPNYHFST